MACLSCCTKTPVFASLHNSGNVNDSPPTKPNTVEPTQVQPPIPITRTKVRRPQSKLQQQLNLIRIERAVGAGSYRDSDIAGSEKRDRDSIIKGLLPNSAGALESPVEKKLRETGEWIIDKTEGEFRSSGKNILMFFFKWVLPIYVLMFLVSFGFLKLPFSVPLLDDLLL